MRIFILEDDPERIKWFQNTFNDCEITYTDDMKVAVQNLTANTYDLIFLDRDLSHPTDSGEDVAWEMKLNMLNPGAAVVVHTVNPRGQRVISRYINEYNNNVHQIPFTSLINMKREDFKFE